jgi:hypothetical protein
LIELTVRPLLIHGETRRVARGRNLGGRGRVSPSRKDASTSSPFASGGIDAARGNPRHDVNSIEPNVVTDLVERDPSLCDESSDEPRPDVEHGSDLVDREQRRSVFCFSVAPAVLPHV